MNKIPIVFAFDNNLSMPAAVCVYSLLMNAKEGTVYDLFVLCRKEGDLDLSQVRTVTRMFPRHTLNVRSVGDIFDKSFEIRGITTPAYYRLLIPSLIPEYDKVIYSDVDVIFRQDLSEVYNLPLDGCLIAGVNDLAHMDRDLRNHYESTLHLDPENVICSGFLVMDTKALRAQDMEKVFLELAKNKYKYQDQDVLNISCAGKINMLEPKYSLLTYIYIYAMQDKGLFLPLWTESQVDEALTNGNVHYNGQKPWKGVCLNFDLWWEYYRRSPVFDENFYFDFFNRQLNLLDCLSLWKRIKTVFRFFTVGRYMK